MAAEVDKLPTRALLAEKAEINVGQIAVLLIALFVKGGVLGAYLPFSTVWLDAKGYNSRHLALLALMDSLGSLLLPLVGSCVDKLRSHNTGFVLMLVTLSALKLTYLPAAGHFAVLLLLAGLTAPLMRACNSVLDALALYAFTERGHFGRARLVGDLGWGSIALFTGWAMDAFGTEDAVFIVFAALCFFLALFWSAARPWMTSIRPDAREMSSEEFCAQARVLLQRCNCPGAIRALATLAFLGMGGGIIGSFELVLLKHMMGSGLLLGGVKMVGTIAALPVWFYMGPLLDWIGLLNVQLIGLTCMAVRLWVLGILTHPWQAFFSEALAGLGGFAVAYCSITIFVGRTVDEDLKGTSQTVIFTVYAGLGAGVGPILASVVSEAHGLQAMFLSSAYALAAIAAALLAHDCARRALGTHRSLEQEMLDLAHASPA